MNKLIKLNLISVLTVLVGTGCEQDIPPVETDIIAQATLVADQSKQESIPAPSSFQIDNLHYLYDTGEHSLSELEMLLQRTDEIMQSSKEEFDELKIALIIHGPDIDFFRRENYPNNQKLIDLAKKLDAMEVMDFKICEASLSSQGISLSDIPDFIELVPFAPTEITRLQTEGFTNL